MSNLKMYDWTYTHGWLPGLWFLSPTLSWVQVLQREWSPKPFYAHVLCHFRFNMTKIKLVRTFFTSKERLKFCLYLLHIYCKDENTTPVCAYVCLHVHMYTHFFINLASLFLDLHIQGYSKPWFLLLKCLHFNCFSPFFSQTMIQSITTPTHLVSLPPFFLPGI